MPDILEVTTTMATKRLYSGSGLNQALLAAGRDLGLDPETIAYAVRPKTHGFLRSPRIVIEVDPAAPRREAPAPAPVRVERPTSPPQDSGRPASARPASARPATAQPFERPRVPLGPDEEARLEALAEEGIAKVRESRQPYLTANLNPAERRIVHLAVRDAGLVTESQGEGRIRPVLISLPAEPQ